jgi:hypothetical protein
LRSVGSKSAGRRTGSLVPPALPVEACECRYGIRGRFHKLRHVVSGASVRVIRDRAIHQLRAPAWVDRMTCSNPIDAAILTDYRLGSRYRRAWHRGAPIRPATPAEFAACRRAGPACPGICPSTLRDYRLHRDRRGRPFHWAPAGELRRSATRGSLHLRCHGGEQHRSADIPLHSQT